MSEISWVVLGFIVVGIGGLMIHHGASLSSEKSTQQIVNQTKETEKNIIKTINDNKTAKIRNKSGKNSTLILNADLTIKSTTNIQVTNIIAITSKKEAKIIAFLLEFGKMH